MRTIYFLITFVLFHGLNLQGQVEATEVVSGLSSPYGVAVHGNILYVTGVDGSKISKVDLTANPPVATDFIMEGIDPNGLLVHGNDLYISEYIADDTTNNRILKVDLTAATPVATEVVGGLTDLELMAIYGNDLYAAQEGSDNIVKIDLTAETPSAIEVVSVDDPVGLAVYGNDLYISKFSSDNIVKIDLTEETPSAIEVVSVGSPTGLAVYENELYIANIATDDGKIVKIDLTSDTPILTDVITIESASPWQLTVVGDILYIADAGSKVLKLDLTTLSVADIPTELSNAGISPNPASDFLQVSDLKAREKYTIYNVLGAEIKSGEVSNNEEIDIRSLSKGLYFLKLVNEDTFEFVKK